MIAIGIEIRKKEISMFIFFLELEGFCSPERDVSKLSSRRSQRIWLMKQIFDNNINIKSRIRKKLCLSPISIKLELSQSDKYLTI